MNLMKILYAVLAVISFLGCAGSLTLASVEFFKIARPEYIPLLQKESDLSKKYFKTDIQNAEFLDQIVKSGLKQKLVSEYGQNPSTSYFYITAPNGLYFITKSEVDLRGADEKVIFTTKLSKSTETNRQTIVSTAQQGSKEIKDDTVVVEYVNFDELQREWQFWGLIGVVALILTSFFSYGYRVESLRYSGEETTYTVM
jgi:hypothetical protein